MGLWPSSWSLWSSPPPPTSPPPSSPTPPTPPPPEPIALAIPPTTTTLQPQTPPDHRDPTITTFQRRKKQLTLYAAGATFFLLTIAVARRATRRRRLATVPKYYTPNTTASELNFNGGVEAFEALNIASLGVASFGMMGIGAGMYILDVVNVEEMRRLVRGRYGSEGRKSEGQVEEELEEWIATVLARKEKKEKERAR
ncbi:hypothetical protein ABW19_dt0210170 [Dactylella cylindrospora]|nr:hypothetical protein ABW19_dt0210170 [Dactylella cylindrospora]